MFSLKKALQGMSDSLEAKKQASKKFTEFHRQEAAKSLAKAQSDYKDLSEDVKQFKGRIKQTWDNSQEAQKAKAK